MSAAETDLEALLAGELRRAIAVDGRSIEAVGRAAGFSRGYLSQILRGRQYLKVQHLSRVLSVLDLPAEEFFWRVFEALRDNGGRGRDLGEGRGIGSRTLPSSRRQERGRTRQSLDAHHSDLLELLRDVVREEVRQQVHPEQPQGGASPGVPDQPRPTQLSKAKIDTPRWPKDPKEALRRAARLDGHVFHAEIEKARLWVQLIVKTDPAERQNKVANARSRFQGPVFCQFLLEEARSRMPGDPAEALSLAEAVLASNERNSGGDSTPAPEIQVPALAVYGNALRASGKIRAAEQVLEEAVTLLDKPSFSGASTVRAEVYRYLGSLRKDQSRTEEALRFLDRSARLYQDLEDDENAARAFLTLGLAHHSRHDAASALSAAKTALQFLEPDGPSWLRAYAVFNVAYHLHAAGEVDLAAAKLEADEALLAASGEQVAAHVVWLKGRIAWSRNQLGPAERLLTEARERILARGGTFDAALIALELALVHLVQGGNDQVQDLANEALHVFGQEELERETSAALELLEVAARNEGITREVLERTVGALEHMRHARLGSRVQS